MADRPILIDQADGACELCAVHKSGTCDHCGEKIISGEWMAGNGYQSPKPHHFHIKPVLGLQGREAVFSELCLGCYRLAHKEAYPDLELPV